MTNFIADILSTFAVQKGLQGLADAEQSGRANGDPAADFASTLMKLRARSLSDEGLPAEAQTALAEAQLQSLAALAAAAPEHATDLMDLGMHSEAMPELPVGIMYPWMLEQPLERDFRLQGTSAQYLGDGPGLAGVFGKSSQGPLGGVLGGGVELAAIRAAAALAAQAQDAPGLSEAALKALADKPGLESMPSSVLKELLAKAESAAAARTGSTGVAGAASGIQSAQGVTPVDPALGTPSVLEATGSTGETDPEPSSTQLKQEPAPQALADARRADRASTLTANAVDPVFEALPQQGDTVDLPALQVRETGPGNSLTAQAMVQPAPTALQGPANAAMNAAPTALSQLQTLFGAAQWAQEFSEQVVGLTLRGDQQVSLHLNPRDLGPLMIEVTLANNQAQLHFLSNQQAVRAAVEQALPQLREVFEEQGIALGDTQVSQQNQSDARGQERDARPGTLRTETLASATGTDPAHAAVTTPSQAPGLVNLYI